MNHADIMRAKILGQFNCTYCRYYTGNDDKDEFCAAQKIDPMPQVHTFENTYCNEFEYTDDGLPAFE